MDSVKSPFGALAGAAPPTRSASASAALGVFPTPVISSSASSSSSSSSRQQQGVPGAAFHSPFQSLLPTNNSASPQPLPSSALPSPSHASSSTSTASIPVRSGSTPSSGASSKFTSPFSSLSSSPRAASFLPGPPSAVTAAPHTAANSNVLAGFPLPAFGPPAPVGASFSSLSPQPPTTSTAAITAATASSLSFPSPSFGSSSGGAVGALSSSGSSGVGSSGLPSGFVSGSLSHPSSALSSFPPSRGGGSSSGGNSFPGSISASLAASQSASPLHRPNRAVGGTPQAGAHPHQSTADDGHNSDGGAVTMEEIKPGTGSLSTPFPLPFPLGSSSASTPLSGGGGAVARSPFSFLQHQQPHASHSGPHSGNATPPLHSGHSVQVDHSTSRPTSASGTSWLGVPSSTSSSRPPTSGGLSGSGNTSLGSTSSIGLSLSMPSSAGASPLPSPRGSGPSTSSSSSLLFAGGPSFGSGVGNAGSGGCISTNTGNVAMSNTATGGVLQSPFAMSPHVAKGMHTSAGSSGPVAQQLKAQPVRSFSAASAATTPTSAYGQHVLPMRSGSVGSTPGTPRVAVAAAPMMPLHRSGAHATAAAQQQPLPARIPPFPASLRASSCSVLGSMLAPSSSSSSSSSVSTGPMATTTATGPTAGKLTTPVAAAALAPFIVTAPQKPSSFQFEREQQQKKKSSSSSSIDDSLAALMSRMSFTLSSLLSEAVASASEDASSSGSGGDGWLIASGAKEASSSATPLVPFSFAEPSPDDVARARLQSMGGSLQRGLTTDAPSLEAREAKKAAAALAGLPGGLIKGANKKQRQQHKGSKRVMGDHDEADESLPGTGFMHAGPQLSRAAVGASIGALSSASVGAGSASEDAATLERQSSLGLSSSGGGVSPLLSETLALLRSRLFLALDKAVLGHKRAVLDEMARGTAVAASLVGGRVRAPREKDVAANAAAAAGSPSDAGSSTPPAHAPGGGSLVRTVSSGRPVMAASAAEEPFSSKAGALLLWLQQQGSSSSSSISASSAALTAAPAQLQTLQSSLRRSRLDSAQSALELLGEDMNSSVRALYERKVAAFAAGRNLAVSSSSSSSTSDAPLELRTPTCATSLLPSALGTLRLLVLGATPGAGVSTLLGQALYQNGRLPFSLVKTRDTPPSYWEVFQGQERTPAGVASEVQASFLPPTIAAFVHAHPKLHELNCRRYHFDHYAHALYTDRYRVQILHHNMGNMHAPGKLYPFKPLSASSSGGASGTGPAAAAHKHASSSSAAASSGSSLFVPPAAQQQNLVTLVALQCDAVLLVVDGSPSGVSGGFASPSKELVSSLLVAQSLGVRHVLVAVTQMDSGSGSACWSEKRFQACTASLISALLKPLGFVPANVTAVPVSGRTGENILRRASKELCAWYDGPTLVQAIDRIVRPADRHADAIADRHLVAMITEAPSTTSQGQQLLQQSDTAIAGVGIKRNLLNDSLVSCVSLRVSVVAGALLAGEPVCMAPTSLVSLGGGGSGLGAPSAPSVLSLAPLGPLQVSSLAREVVSDPRDHAVYEDEQEDPSGGGGGGASDNHQAAEAKAAAAAATAQAAIAAAVAKAKASAAGKLTHADRKAAVADAKKEHARAQAKKEKAGKADQGAWKAEQEAWVRAAEAEAAAEAMEVAAAEANAAAAQAQADADAEMVAQQQLVSGATASSSRSPHFGTSTSSSSSSLQASPCVLEGDHSAVVSLSCVPRPPHSSDDDLSNLLSGKNVAEDLTNHSDRVLQHVVATVRPGDLIVLPLPGASDSGPSSGAGSSGSSLGGGLRFVTSFKAEVLPLPSWSEEVRIGNGQVVTLVPLGRQPLPNPAAVGYASPASLLAMISASASASASTSGAASSDPSSLPLGSAKVCVERLMSVLNRSTRAVARKRPEFLTGPSSESSSSGPEVAVVEFTCSGGRPMVLDTFAAGGARLGAFLLVHQNTVLALVTVTHILAHV